MWLLRKIEELGVLNALFATCTFVIGILRLLKEAISGESDVFKFHFVDTTITVNSVAALKNHEYKDCKSAMLAAWRGASSRPQDLQDLADRLNCDEFVVQTQLSRETRSVSVTIIINVGVKTDTPAQTFNQARVVHGKCEQCRSKTIRLHAWRPDDLLQGVLGHTPCKELCVKLNITTPIGKGREQLLARLRKRKQAKVKAST